MRTAATQLLQRLGSGIVPTGVTPPSDGGAADGPDFLSMLSSARSGRLETGLPVDVSAEPGLELSEEQHQRLSAAIDRLTASDAQHALVLLDGHALLTEPGARRVTGRADLNSGTPVVGIDSLAAAPSGEPRPARTGAAPLFKNPFRALARIPAEPLGEPL